MTRHNLILIGSGQMLTKYILPALTANPAFHFTIKHILGLKSPADFKVRRSVFHSAFKKILTHCRYSQTAGTPTDILRHLQRIAQPRDIIAILTPPQNHFQLLDSILQKTPNLIFMEKPALVNTEEFAQLQSLLAKFPHRIFFAGKYGQVRAQKLYAAFTQHQPVLGPVERIELRLEEGTEYYHHSQNWFPVIGPELDLVYHLLDILFHLFPKAQIINPQVFLPANYTPGFGISLIFALQLHQSRVPVAIQAGKRLGPSNRFVAIQCQQGTIEQYYSSGSSEDPVFLVTKHSRLLDKNPKNYHHYAVQLDQLKQWIQHPFTQELLPKILSACLLFRELRFQKERTGMAKFKAKKPKLIAVIPARLGSKRIPGKNLKLLSGNPLIYYAIRAAKYAHVFDDIYVNSESQEIGDIGLRMGVKFYQRPAALAADNVKNEDFNYNFLQHIPCDYLFMINPTSPLLTPNEIRDFVHQMLADRSDTQFSVQEHKAQTIFQGKPINFSYDKPHISSQNLDAAYTIQWAITGWKVKPFMKKYEKDKFACYTGKIGVFPLQDTSAIDIDYPHNFTMAENMMFSVKKTYRDYLHDMQRSLHNLDENSVELVADTLLKAYQEDRQVFSIGNGGSAATASHFALQLAREANRGIGTHFRSMSLTDNLPLITSLANDEDFGQIFVSQLKNLLKERDVLIAFSSNGNSENIIKAIEYANSIGATTVGLLGGDGGKAKKIVNISMVVASDTQDIAEDIHLILGHILTRFFQTELPKLHQL